ncbi:putative NYN domain, limkain-b1-type, meiosis regulator and mRNA stability factor 1 [Arabidopsis thaliana]
MFLVLFISCTVFFWDVEDCPVPDGLTAEAVWRNMRMALANNGEYLGRCEITGFGDYSLATKHAGIGMMCSPLGQLHTLSLSFTYIYRRQTYQTEQDFSGISLPGNQITFPNKICADPGRHLRPLGDKDARLERIIVDFLCCAIGNPEIDNLMLIVGDLSGHSEFELAAHLMRCLNFTVFLAQPQNASQQLLKAVPTKWLWSSLSAARNAELALNAKLLNGSSLK